MSSEIPRNLAEFTADEVLAATAGQLVQRGPQPGRGVCTDSRHVLSGNVFVALAGETFDGHAFVPKACAAGASILVVSAGVTANEAVSIVKVPDTMVALGQLARAHKRRWTRQARQQGHVSRLVAITGSAGKTTTSRAVSAALEALAPGHVHSVPGNLNNAVGVPAVLFGLESHHCYAVVEIGTNSPGEIAYGAALAEPDIGVLTLVACAHGEGLGSTEQIAWEKGALLESLGHDGVAIVNADDARAAAQLMRGRARLEIKYGAAGDQVQVRIGSRLLLGRGAQRVQYYVLAHGEQRTLEITTPLLGEAGGYALAAALAVVLAESSPGTNWTHVGECLGRAQPEAGRLAVQQLHSGALLLDDSYNANPASMLASIATAAELARLERHRLVLVLGEMRELGAESANGHEQVGLAARSSGAALLFAIGEQAKRYVRAESEAGLQSFWAESSEAAAGELRGRIQAGDVILVKGSRAVALDKVVRALRSEESS